MFSILAVCFLFMIVAIAIFGTRMISRATPPPSEVEYEKCSICGNRFRRDELLVRQKGDYKLYHFCKNCLEGLFAELRSKTN
jgi:tRNA U54 and U55 pseudouridine synthase Pus10